MGDRRRKLTWDEMVELEPRLDELLKGKLPPGHDCLDDALDELVGPLCNHPDKRMRYDSTCNFAWDYIIHHQPENMPGVCHDPHAD